MSFRHACAAACALALAVAALPDCAPAHPLRSRAAARVTPAPLPHHVLRRLARRARRLHARHPRRQAYAIFVHLAHDWRRNHRRPAPDAVIASIHRAAQRYGLDPAGMVRIARCESRLDRHATNGQYLGLFQLGSSERERYLDGDWRDSYANALAAARYARDSGGFEPWTCGYAYA